MHPTDFSPYAPVRYRRYPWWHFALKVAKDGFVTQNGHLARHLPDYIEHALTEPMRREAVAEFAGDPDGEAAIEHYHAMARELQHWVPLAAQYELCGRQIFDLGDALVDMLTHTDLPDAPLSDWHPPFNAFYLRFGPQSNIKLRRGNACEYLEGVFVSVTEWGAVPGERCLNFGFTLTHDDGRGVTMPGPFLSLNPDEQKLSLCEGIAASITRREASMPGTADVAKAVTDIQRGTMEDGLFLLQQGCTLLANSLLYLESVRHTRAMASIEPGRDTPTALRQAWADQPATRTKLRSRMTRDGYVVVYMLGTGVAHPASTTGGTVKSHWRRGHWRMQRVGPGLEQTELRWVRPTLVNADQPHDDLPGHIYAVGGEGSADPRH